MSEKQKYYYKAFGWSIASEIEFPELSTAPESKDIDLHIRFDQVPLTLDHAIQPGINTHTKPGQFLLRATPHLRFLAQQGSEILIDRAKGIEDDEVRVYLLASAFGAIAHQRGLLPLHASAIVHNDQAYLFAGQTGSGKSSMAAAFHKKGYQVYAEDLSAIHFSTENQPLLNFGSVRIKLWQDTLESLREPTEAHSKIRQGIGKYSYAFSPPHQAPAIPVARLYILQPTQGALPDMVALSHKDRFRESIIQTFRQRLIPGMGVEMAHFKMCEKFSAAVSAYRFIRPIENADLNKMASFIEAHIKQG